MSAVKTLQIRIVNPQAERLIGDLVSQNLIEIDEPEISNEEISKMSREAMFGCMQGQFEMADDFDTPLELVPEKPSKLPFGFGCMKGKIWMADDFDAPLEDFEEYM